MTVQHTPEQIQQLKSNAEYILGLVDMAAEKSSPRYFFPLISMLCVYGLIVTNSMIVFTIYLILVMVGTVVFSFMGAALMNVYSIHANPSLEKIEDANRVSVYRVILNNYKSVGVIVFTTIIECYWLVAIASTPLLAVGWAITCLVSPVVAIRLHKTYTNIKRVHEYAVQNS